MLHPFKFLNCKRNGVTNKVFNIVMSFLPTEQKEIIKENFLNRFLNGGTVGEEKFLEGFKYFGTYVVITYVIENKEGERDLNEIERYENQFQQNFNYKKIFSNSKETTYLISIRPEDRYVEVINSIFIESYNKEAFYIGGVSKPYTDIRQIKKAYEESRIALNYSCVNCFENSVSINYYHDSLAETKSQMDICIIDTEQIVNNINTGNVDGLKAHLNNFINKNIDKPYTIQKELFSYLVNIFFAVINSKNMTTEDFISVDFTEYMSKIKEVYNIKLIYNMVIDCYIRLVEKVSEDKGELIDRIVEFIKNNYHNQISLQIVADEFDISLTYVSQYFKKTSGMNFLDFIRDIRIEKAKDLLRDKNISINEVAQQTGFETVNTFIKVFKKLNGITPGEYKNNMITDYEKNPSISYAITHISTCKHPVKNNNYAFNSYS